MRVAAAGCWCPAGEGRAPCGRGFRGPALGRNNFYGSKSKRGTEVAAILYSLVETAKLVGVDPKRYLKVALAAALKGERIAPVDARVTHRLRRRGRLVRAG